MINQLSIQRIAARVMEGGLIAPDYQQYGFARIPHFLRSVLGGRSAAELSLPSDVAADVQLSGIRKILFILCDAFGWMAFERYLPSSPLLKHLAEHGTVSKLTAQFPSTTTAHIPTLHSGLEVGQHGLYEWYIYEPSVQRMICPLMFSFAGDKESGTLTLSGAEPESVFGSNSWYNELNGEGIAAHVLQSDKYSSSVATRAICAGAAIHSFSSLQQGLRISRELLEQAKQPSLVSLYYDAFDASAHVHGPQSTHTDLVARQFLDDLSAFLTDLEGTEAAKDTLLVLSADHGQTRMHPAQTIYLDNEFPELVSSVLRDKHGRELAPAGSARDLFLHIRASELEGVYALLSDKLAASAKVFMTADLAARGLFGSSPPGERLLSRIGNLAVLPLAEKAVYWSANGRFSQGFLGHHGGLTPDEIEIPLVVYRPG